MELISEILMGKPRIKDSFLEFKRGVFISYMFPV
jgi:hypothetical protein